MYGRSSMSSGSVELLDAVDYGGGPQRSSCGPVFKRVRLGWRSGRSRTRLRIRGIVGSIPTINTTLGACEGLDVVWPWSSRRGRSVQVKLIKMGGRLVRHSRRLIFQLSEVSVPRRLFEGVLDRIGRLSPAPN